MLSEKDFLLHPEELQPLGSRKGVLNKPTPLHIDIVKLFLYPGNSATLRYSLFSVYQQNGGKGREDRFAKLIVLLQRKFARENKLHEYIPAEFQAVGYINYVDALGAINQDFIKFVYKYFKWNVFNPYHDDIEVGPWEARVLKKSEDITADDFGTLDLWREQTVLTMNKFYRDGNKIPAYRTGIHARHYDRDNEGFSFSDPDRSSLEAPIYGYDMGQICKDIGKYKKKEWWSV